VTSCLLRRKFGGTAYSHAAPPPLLLVRNIIKRKLRALGTRAKRAPLCAWFCGARKLYRRNSQIHAADCAAALKNIVDQVDVGPAEIGPRDDEAVKWKLDAERPVKLTDVAAILCPRCAAEDHDIEIQRCNQPKKVYADSIVGGKVDGRSPAVAEIDSGGCSKPGVKEKCSGLGRKRLELIRHGLREPARARITYKQSGRASCQRLANNVLRTDRGPSRTVNLGHKGSCGEIVYRQIGCKSAAS
jgi:hypothetical protein